MRIEHILEVTLKKSALKRVRIKVDPKVLVQQGYEYCPSFEGYILQECGNMTSVKVYLTNVPPGINPIQTVDKKYISDVPKSRANMDEIKEKIVKFLVSNKGLTSDDAILARIKSCNDFDTLESFLKEKLDDKSLSELYKNLILY